MVIMTMKKTMTTLFNMFDNSHVFISADSHSNYDVDYDDYYISGAVEDSWPYALSNVESEMALLLKERFGCMPIS